MKYKYLEELFIVSIVFFFSINFQLIVSAQNTVGVTSIDADRISDGYNLLYPHNQPNVYLLNNCGEVVHSWEDSTHFRPGNIAYLTEDGLLFKTKRPAQLASPAIGAGGAGGIIELRDWDNQLLWQTTLMDTLVRAHHDIAPLPNGNVLILSWESKSLNEIVEAGRDTASFSENALWPDFIIEVNPFLDSIVWEWHAWDHLIQEFDATKPNFGKVNSHPELIDLNYDLLELGGKPDWMHTNAIDYNPALDQILLSVPFFNEIWIIDHSTTTLEAEGHTGGKAGKGGDLLFRWGNPRTYRQGTLADQQLFFQHDANWIRNVDSDGYSIALFNNRVAENRSEATILTPDYDILNKNYNLSEDLTFLPETVNRTLSHPIPEKMYSSGLSSIQLLPTGNALICVGRQGYSFEITPENKIVWEYITPFKMGEAVPQGTLLELNDNMTFRINRYPLDYLAFENKDLSPKGKLEIGTALNCSQLSVGIASLESASEFEVFPIPTSQNLSLKFDKLTRRTIRVYDLTGKIVLTRQFDSKFSNLDVSFLAEGLYFLSVNNKFTPKKISIMH